MTTTPMATILNCTTGEVIERPLTEEELAQNEIARNASIAREAELQAEAEAKAEIKASAEAKLTALGLTAEEIAALTK